MTTITVNLQQLRGGKQAIQGEFLQYTIGSYVHFFLIHDKKHECLHGWRVSHIVSGRKVVDISSNRPIRSARDRQESAQEELQALRDRVGDARVQATLLEALQMQIA